MFWKLFSKKKPKKNGWYLCTVEVPGQQRYIMDLYWYGELERFKDNRRQNVFDTHKVFTQNPFTPGQYIEYRLYTEHLCDRTDNVIAWRKLPKTYMRGFVETD